MEYLKTPLNAQELGQVLDALAMQPSQLIRKKDPLYQEHFGTDVPDDAGCLDAMVRYPKLMERPIALKGYKAALGRPPENVLKLL